MKMTLGDAIKLLRSSGLFQIYAAPGGQYLVRNDNSVAVGSMTPSQLISFAQEKAASYGISVM